MLWATWWVWASAALVLAVLEMLLPSYIFLGFALGAALTAAIFALGAGMTLPWTLVVFALMSLLAYIGLRLVFRLEHGQVKVWDRDINE